MRVKKFRDDVANLLSIVKAMAMGRPIKIHKPRFDKVQWEREYIRACEQEQLEWQYGKPEDIDPER